MVEGPPVVVYPAAEAGGRRVRVGAQFVGMAYMLLDVAESCAAVAWTMWSQATWPTSGKTTSPPSFALRPGAGGGAAIDDDAQALG